MHLMFSFTQSQSQYMLICSVVSSVRAEIECNHEVFAGNYLHTISVTVINRNTKNHYLVSIVDDLLL